MRRLLELADHVDALTRAFGKLATALLLLLIALVAWNVGGRYLGGGGSVALQELEWHLLGPIALLGLTVSDAGARSCAGGHGLQPALDPGQACP